MVAFDFDAVRRPLRVARVLLVPASLDGGTILPCFHDVRLGRSLLCRHSSVSARRARVFLSSAGALFVARVLGGCTPCTRPAPWTVRKTIVRIKGSMPASDKKPTPEQKPTPPSMKKPSSNYLDRYRKSKKTLFPEGGTPEKANGAKAAPAAGDEVRRCCVTTTVCL